MMRWTPSGEHIGSVSHQIEEILDSVIDLRPWDHLRFEGGGVRMSDLLCADYWQIWKACDHVCGLNVL